MEYAALLSEFIMEPDTEIIYFDGKSDSCSLVAFTNHSLPDYFFVFQRQLLTRKFHHSLLYTASSVDSWLY